MAMMVKAQLRFYLMGACLFHSFYFNHRCWLFAFHRLLNSVYSSLDSYFFSLSFSFQLQTAAIETQPAHFSLKL
jgi:hypothetical protein